MKTPKLVKPLGKEIPLRNVEPEKPPRENTATNNYFMSHVLTCYTEDGIVSRTYIDWSFD